MRARQDLATFSDLCVHGSEWGTGRAKSLAVPTLDLLRIGSRHSDCEEFLQDYSGSSIFRLNFVVVMHGCKTSCLNVCMSDFVKMEVKFPTL
jgi:hypothetical protein